MSCTNANVPITRAKSRKNRIFVFHDFLESTYGIEYLRQGVVLDVAGGKGDLSWLFQNVHLVESVVVDPRATSNAHWIRSVEYLRLHPDESRRRAAPNCPTYQPLAAILDRLPSKLRTPRHLRILVDQKLIEALSRHKATGSVEEWDEYFFKAVSIGSTAQPLMGQASRAKRSTFSCEPSLNATTEPFNDSKRDTGTSIQDAREALAVLLKVRLVVGFHPDQAVDACLDLAKLLKVPFCVVPCCVFPREFPQRYLVRTDGRKERVRSYDQLVAFLSRKEPMCEVGYLNFYSEPGSPSPARNIVLFTRPATERPPP
jgi:hypothetical protein